jgi:hypothetical protein
MRKINCRTTCDGAVHPDQETAKRHAEKIYAVKIDRNQADFIKEAVDNRLFQIAKIQAKYGRECDIYLECTRNGWLGRLKATIDSFVAADDAEAEEMRDSAIRKHSGALGA